MKGSGVLIHIFLYGVFPAFMTSIWMKFFGPTEIDGITHSFLWGSMDSFFWGSKYVDVFTINFGICICFFGGVLELPIPLANSNPVADRSLAFMIGIFILLSGAFSIYIQKI